VTVTPSESGATPPRETHAFYSNVDADVRDLQEAYLERLRRLLRLRRDHHAQLNEVGVHLLDRSIFAAYCDCLDVGAGLLAQHLLREGHARGSTFRTIISSDLREA
jgi:hypothetical protein